jgi:predicted dehydrogenase
VLIEKPIAGKAADVEKMIAMRGDRVVACCSSRKSFTGHAEAATRCVASGALGTIRLVRIRALHGASPAPNPDPPPWRQSMARNGGGILVNWSCYDLDYVLQIIGWQVEPRSVFAQWWPVADGMANYVAPGSDADSHYTALIACEDGIVLSMERAEFSTATSDEAWEIIGTEGTLHLPMQSRKGKPGAVILNRFVPGEGVTSETLWEEGGGDPGGGVLEEFVGAVRGGPTPRTGLDRALVMQKITDAIYASAESGQSVPIS